MSLDLDFATKLKAELDQIIKEGVEGLTGGLTYDKYQQACGFIEAMRQVRDGLIPKALEELQRR
jgi:hypothetical protein